MWKYFEQLLLVTLSLTVTNCVAVIEFPLPSVTVQITVVPVKATGALFVNDATEQLSFFTGLLNYVSSS
jgi:hypothetical protein